MADKQTHSKKKDKNNPEQTLASILTQKNVKAPGIYDIFQLHRDQKKKLEKTKSRKQNQSGTTESDTVGKPSVDYSQIVNQQLNKAERFNEQARPSTLGTEKLFQESLRLSQKTVVGAASLQQKSYLDVFFDHFHGEMNQGTPVVKKTENEQINAEKSDSLSNAIKVEDEIESTPGEGLYKQYTNELEKWMTQNSKENDSGNYSLTQSGNYTLDQSGNFSEDSDNEGEFDLSNTTMKKCILEELECSSRDLGYEVPVILDQQVESDISSRRKKTEIFSEKFDEEMEEERSKLNRDVQEMKGKLHKTLTTLRIRFRNRGLTPSAPPSTEEIKNSVDSDHILCSTSHSPSEQYTKHSYGSEDDLPAIMKNSPDFVGSMKGFSVKGISESDSEEFFSVSSGEEDTFMDLTDSSKIPQKREDDSTGVFNFDPFLTPQNTPNKKTLDTHQMIQPVS